MPYGKDIKQKLIGITKEEEQTLSDAVKVGLANTEMDAIHIALDLLRGHVVAKMKAKS